LIHVLQMFIPMSYVYEISYKLTIVEVIGKVTIIKMNKGHWSLTCLCCQYDKKACNPKCTDRGEP